jgi:putative toxin-antitoxin system antitoxin component (TIGR02293 family)
MATSFSMARFVRSPALKQARAVAGGLPAEALRELASDPAITIAALARVVAPRRTLDRRLKEARALPPDESDRLARFMTVLALASRVFGTRADAMAWLDRPLAAFDRECPLDMLRTDSGTRVVEQHLERAIHGMFA